MYENMVKSIDPFVLPNVESLLGQFRTKLPKVYIEKKLTSYCDVLNLVLKIGIKLDYTIMILYLPSRPRLADSLVSQFQNINKVLATRDQNKEWFNDLFALIVALPAYLSLTWDQVEKRIIEINMQNR
jgi:dimeric dUTPase (all-alpha-NTP-PPase superfamily)